MLIYTYDEHGGYYDHVPPPPAVKPDNIPPGADEPGITGAYDRYGFRVPTVDRVAVREANYVSHQVHDHTSILKLIETKWNLGALTYRDANADDLLDSLDLVGPPAFAEPPTLPAPGQARDLQARLARRSDPARRRDRARRARRRRCGSARRPSV